MKTLKSSSASVVVTHNAGFYSCCSVRLDMIIAHYNNTGTYPSIVDSSAQFALYKPVDNASVDNDISGEFFVNYVGGGEKDGDSSTSRNTSTKNTTTTTTLQPQRPIEFSFYDQFTLFSLLDYAAIVPFVVRYFTPTDEIFDMCQALRKKYQLDYNNTCVLYYRGLDKCTECRIPSYDEMFTRAFHVLQNSQRPMRLLVQSDETEFILAAQQVFGASGIADVIVFADETRTLPRSIAQVDKVFQNDNYNLHYAKWFLAITVTMAQCATVVCNTGNCGLWVCLFRGNARGVHQYGNGAFYVA